MTPESSDDLAARPYVSKDNLRMTERDVAIRELLLYRDAGGKSFVDVSGRIPGWHPDDLVVASEATGVNIVASTGWYISPAHPPSHAEASVDELAEMLVKHIEVGIEGTDVRAGVIGELGMTEPLHPLEEKVLRAGGRAQARTGVPLTVHPMVFKKEAHQYIDILEAEGANLDKVYISHMDGSCPDYEYHESVMDRGVSIDYDLFGDTSWNDAYLLFGGDHWVSDHERVETLARLCADGYSQQIMLAQDRCLKRTGSPTAAKATRMFSPRSFPNSSTPVSPKTRSTTCSSKTRNESSPSEAVPQGADNTERRRAMATVRTVLGEIPSDESPFLPMIPVYACPTSAS